ncbi:MAG: dockerin type I domain-containing protein [Pirellulales bacterium]
MPRLPPLEADKVHAILNRTLPSEPDMHPLKSIAQAFRGRLFAEWKKKSLQKAARVRSRIAKARLIEQLERRDLMAAAIWHNVAQPYNVDGDVSGRTTPTDALQVINYLNARSGGLDGSGLLPKQSSQAKNPFLDVNADGRVSAVDALLIVNRLNRRDSNLPTLESGVGVYPTLISSPELVESSSLVSEIAQELHVPFENAAIKVTIQTPKFDNSSSASMRDAFEIVLQNANQRFVFPSALGVPAAFNWSEGLAPSFAQGVTFAPDASGLPGDVSVTIPLTGMKSGDQLSVVSRLVNNDSDSESSIVFRGLRFVQLENTIASPEFISPKPQPPSFDTSTLDLLKNVSVVFLKSSFDSQTNELLSEVAVHNNSSAIMGRLVVAARKLKAKRSPR